MSQPWLTENGRKRACARQQEREVRGNRTISLQAGGKEGAFLFNTDVKVRNL